MPLSPAEAFGRAIRDVRRERRLSQEDAALASGIDRAYYGHVERATKTPTLTTVWRIARALDTRPSELLRRAEELLAP
ncbi:MAG: helix-turn-helix domain-containing protein [Conexibacter sp.]